MIEILSITPEVDGWTFIGFTVLSAFTSAFGVVAGLGGGVLMIGVMATVLPAAALIPIHGAVQAGTNLTRIAIMRRLVRTHAILPFVAGAVIGGSAGGSIVVSLPPAVLQLVLGAFLVYVAWFPAMTAGAPTSRRFFVLGAAGGLISMFVGATGTLLAPWVRGVSPDRRIFVATHAAIMLFIHVLKIVVFSILGFAFFEYIPLLAAMIAMSFAGNWVGVNLLDRMPEHVFRRVFQVVLTLLALRLLWSAGEGFGLEIWQLPALSGD